MADDILNPEVHVEEKTPIKVPLDRIGFYDNCEKFQRIEEYQEFIAGFRDYYIQERMKDQKRSAIKICNEYNRQIAPMKIHPYPKYYRDLRKKWDAEVEMRLAEAMTERRNKLAVQDAVKLRNEANLKVIPGYEDLEAGTQTLAGHLVNDAMTMLSEDQAFGAEELQPDELLGRRKYVLGVLNYVSKMTQGKEHISIKRNAEKRETANFLMDLLKRGTAGKVGEEEIKLLKDSIIPNGGFTIPAQPAGVSGEHTA